MNKIHCFQIFSWILFVFVMLKACVVFLPRPFSISPPNGVLGVNESMQITVEFKPTTVGDHQADLVLRYDTGKLVAHII